MLVSRDGPSRTLYRVALGGSQTVLVLVQRCLSGPDLVGPILLKPFGSTSFSLESELVI